MDLSHRKAAPSLNGHARSGYQRIVEGWLPLAQAANQQYGWQLDGSALEALIIAAAPALAVTQSALGARAVLWQVYQRQGKDER